MNQHPDRSHDNDLEEDTVSTYVPFRETVADFYNFMSSDLGGRFKVLANSSGRFASHNVYQLQTLKYNHNLKGWLELKRGDSTTSLDVKVDKYAAENISKVSDKETAKVVISLA